MSKPPKKADISTSKTEYYKLKPFTLYKIIPKSQSAFFTLSKRKLCSEKEREELTPFFVYCLSIDHEVYNLIKDGKTDKVLRLSRIFHRDCVDIYTMSESETKTKDKKTVVVQ